jgi:hypothetical protein
MTTYGYARVSTDDQDLTIQHEALKAAGCTVIRSEKKSGTSRKGRAELERPTPHPRAPKTEPRRAPATPIPVEKMEVAPLPPLRVTEDVPRKRLLDLERHECRWPVGDPRQGAFGFCALPKAPDRPYCDAHTRRALMRDACQSATAHGADTSSPQG